MKRLSVLLIIAGILVAAYPVARHTYTWYWQKRMLDAWEKSITPALADSYSALNDVLEMAVENETKFITTPGTDKPQETYGTGNFSGEQEVSIQGKTSNNLGSSADEAVEPEEPQETNRKDAAVLKDMIGILEISKIDARLPVLNGTSADKLRIGAGMLEGSAPIGEIGNTIISAHRSHNYGQMFNRLNELALGDEIVICTKDNSYLYKVFEIKVVEPSDTSVLAGNNKDRILTLTTCEPLYISTHRLIVRARMD